MLRLHTVCNFHHTIPGHLSFPKQGAQPSLPLWSVPSDTEREAFFKDCPFFGLRSDVDQKLSVINFFPRFLMIKAFEETFGALKEQEDVF